MADYQEQTATGKTWKRCNSVEVVNPYGQIPFVRFSEEEIVSVAGKTIQSPAGFCAATFKPAKSIALLDPATGESTGKSITHSDLYQILFSLYIETALARDAKNESAGA